MDREWRRGGGWGEIDEVSGSVAGQWSVGRGVCVCVGGGGGQDTGALPNGLTLYLPLPHSAIGMLSSLGLTQYHQGMCLVENARLPPVTCPHSCHIPHSGGSRPRSELHLMSLSVVD